MHSTVRIIAAALLCGTAATAQAQTSVADFYKGKTVTLQVGSEPAGGYDVVARVVAKHMAGQDIVIEVDIGIGKGKAEIWTCDLTHRYIDINGSYRS